MVLVYQKMSLFGPCIGYQKKLYPVQKKSRARGFEVLRNVLNMIHFVVLKRVEESEAKIIFEGCKEL